MVQSTKSVGAGGLGRRAFLTRASLAAGVVAAAPAAWAGQAPTPRVKGPLVWMEMDQKELDDAYDQNIYAPNRTQIRNRYATNSELTRRRLGAPRRVSYGTPAIEAIDIFTTTQPNAPVHVHVHGGAWREGLAQDSAFLAEPFVRAGAHFAVVDFNNVLETKGDLMMMVDQVQRAVAWVVRNAKSFGGDPDRVYLSGHSSGAHLAGVALVSDWRGRFGLPVDCVKGAVLLSGMYDMKPVRLSARSSYVTFTDASEASLSMQRALDRLHTPLIVAYGTFETPEFQRQSRDVAAAVKAAGKPVELIVGDGYNHFELLETMANPYGVVGRAALGQMGLNS